MMDPRIVKVSGLTEAEMELLYSQTYRIFNPPLTVKCTRDEQGYVSIALDTTLSLPQTLKDCPLCLPLETYAQLSRSEPMRSTVSGISSTKSANTTGDPWATKTKS